jgi:hypothetical protein
MRVTLKAMEAYLRESGTPYVVVDEAKKALFAGVSLKSFDFVAYSESRPNWLITCKPFSWGERREVMRQWEVVFGNGFAAVEVRCRRGRFVLVTLDGKTIELPPAKPQETVVTVAPTEAAPPEKCEPAEQQPTLFETEVQP